MIQKNMIAEVNHYNLIIGMYNRVLGILLSVDPMSDKYPSLSPYNYCALNPLKYVDPDGRGIDPTSPGYEEATNAANPNHSSYQPAFAKLYNDWKSPENDNINVQFIDDMSQSLVPTAGGTIQYGGTDNGGNNGAERDVYMVFWDKSISNKLGTSALFEEAKHLDDGLSGKFDIKQGCIGFSIVNEVEAKKWVVENIKNITGSYMENGVQKPTHFGYFLLYPNELTPQSLGMGVTVSNMTPKDMQQAYLFGTGVKSYYNLYRAFLLKQAKIILPQITN